MANLFSKNYNKRTRFTRMCIGEAVFALMDVKEYEKIKVSDIVKRAGVSRMTFYHYYETKEDALADFLHEIVAGYVRDRVAEKGKVGRFQEMSSIIDAMNEYMMKRIQPHYKIPAYELYFYGGALLNVFIQWEKGGKMESVEEIAKIIAKL